MKTSCLRLKLVELTSLQVSMLMIREKSVYLTYLNTHSSHQDEPFHKMTIVVKVTRVSDIHD